MAKKKQEQQPELVREAPVVHCLGKMVPIEEVKPNPENPNVHPDEQLEVLADVLRVNGWRQPIVVSRLSGMVVKGHGRLQTAKFMKLKEVPVDYQDYVDAQAEFQDMIADNRVAQLAYVDAFKLGGLLKKMSAEGQKHLGYTREEIQLFSAAEYVAPQETDRRFVVLETLKLTKEDKAIIGGAVQKYCLRVGREADWGEALSQICMAWQVVVLPTMPQAAMEKTPAPKPAEPKDQEAVTPRKRKGKAAEPVPAAAEPAPSQVTEREFRVKYLASTSLPDGEATVVRTDDDFAGRVYTRDKAVEALAKAAKEAGRRVRGALEQRGGVAWLIHAEEVA